MAEKKSVEELVEDLVAEEEPEAPAEDEVSAEGADAPAAEPVRAIENDALVLSGEIDAAYAEKPDDFEANRPRYNVVTDSYGRAIRYERF